MSGGASSEPTGRADLRDLPAAEMGANQGSPRDVLVDRILTWLGDDYKVYDYADRLIKDLYSAGYEIVEREP